MNNNLKDLNLLRIFEALWLDRNVSKASKRLGLSQPALSHALSRLRVEMRDDVFVRSGRGVTPTPQAQIWAPKVLGALHHLEKALSESEVFSPLAAEGRITIIGTDLIEYLLFPKLLKLFSAQSPNIVLVSRPSDGQFPKIDMENGYVDFAIAGFFKDIPEGFYQQQVGVEHYMSLVRKNNPNVNGSLDLKVYQSLSHVLTSPQGDLTGVVDLELKKIQAKRKVVAGVTTFQVIGKIVSETDFCATIPRSLAYDLAKLYDLEVFQPPISIEPIYLKMIWHDRIHNNPLHQWVRREIQKILEGIFQMPNK